MPKTIKYWVVEKDGWDPLGSLAYVEWEAGTSIPEHGYATVKEACEKNHLEYDGNEEFTENNRHNRK
jgi:hypothetical protein